MDDEEMESQDVDSMQHAQGGREGKEQLLSGHYVPLALRILFDAKQLPPSAQSVDGPKAQARPLMLAGTTLHLRALLHGDVRCATNGRGDGRADRTDDLRTDRCRGPFDKADSLSALVLRRQPRAGCARAAIGFADVTDGADGNTQSPRASLAVGNSWTICGWLQLPLPQRPRMSPRWRFTLAMGLPHDKEGLPSDDEGPLAEAQQGEEGGQADRRGILPVCHVVLADDKGVGTLCPGVVVVRPEAPSERETVLCRRLDLNALPHGWHHLAAVGAGGRTQFFIDGRLRGHVDCQVTEVRYAAGSDPLPTRRVDPALLPRSWSRSWRAQAPTHSHAPG